MELKLNEPPAKVSLVFTNNIFDVLYDRFATESSLFKTMEEDEKIPSGEFKIPLACSKENQNSLELLLNHPHETMNFESYKTHGENKLDKYKIVGNVEELYKIIKFLGLYISYTGDTYKEKYQSRGNFLEAFIIHCINDKIKLSPIHELLRGEYTGAKNSYTWKPKSLRTFNNAKDWRYRCVIYGDKSDWNEMDLADVNLFKISIRKKMDLTKLSSNIRVVVYERAINYEKLYEILTTKQWSAFYSSSFRFLRKKSGTEVSMINYMFILKLTNELASKFINLEEINKIESEEIQVSRDNGKLSLNLELYPDIELESPTRLGDLTVNIRTMRPLKNIISIDTLYVMSDRNVESGSIDLSIMEDLIKKSGQVEFQTYRGESVMSLKNFEYLQKLNVKMRGKVHVEYNFD